VVALRLEPPNVGFLLFDNAEKHLDHLGIMRQPGNVPELLNSPSDASNDFVVIHAASTPEQLCALRHPCWSSFRARVQVRDNL